MPPRRQSRRMSPRGHAQAQTWRREAREVQQTASGYGPESIALGIFFLSTITLAMMGNGLAIALGGPILTTPFVYVVLKGYSPEQVVSEMTKPPGGDTFDLGGRR